MRVSFPAWGAIGELTFARYGDGTLALTAMTTRGEPLARLTVCLDGLGAPILGPHQAWLKTWSENEGVLDALISAGVVTRAGQVFVVNQWGDAAVMVDLTPEAVFELEGQELLP